MKTGLDIYEEISAKIKALVMGKISTRGKTILDIQIPLEDFKIYLKEFGQSPDTPAEEIKHAVIASFFGIEVRLHPIR